MDEEQLAKAKQHIRDIIANTPYIKDPSAAKITYNTKTKTLTVSIKLKWYIRWFGKIEDYHLNLMNWIVEVLRNKENTLLTNIENIKLNTK